MIDVSARVDPFSLARVMKWMEAQAEAIDMGIAGRGTYGGGAIEFTAVKLITALRASTVISRPKREVIPNPLFQQAQIDAVQKGAGNRAARKAAKKALGAAGLPWAVRFDFRKVNGGVPLANGGSFLPLRGAFTKSAANSSELVPLLNYGGGGMRGISKRSWNWTLKSIGKSDGAEWPGATESSFVRFKSNGEMLATWTGTNKLHYMGKIMTRSVSASFHAAAEMMKRAVYDVVTKACRRAA